MNPRISNISTSSVKSNFVPLPSFHRPLFSNSGKKIERNFNPNKKRRFKNLDIFFSEKHIRKQSDVKPPNHVFDIYEGVRRRSLFIRKKKDEQKKISKSKSKKKKIKTKFPEISKFNNKNKKKLSNKEKTNIFGKKEIEKKNLRSEDKKIIWRVKNRSCPPKVTKEEMINMFYTETQPKKREKRKKKKIKRRIHSHKNKKKDNSIIECVYKEQKKRDNNLKIFIDYKLGLQEYNNLTPNGDIKMKKGGIVRNMKKLWLRKIRADKMKQLKNNITNS